MNHIEFLLTWFGNHKDALESLKSLFTVVAIVVGAIWTYRAFVRKRHKYPRAKLGQSISSWRFPDEKTLLRVCVRIENVGEVLLKLPAGEIWVQQMLPCPQEVKEKITGGGDPVLRGEAQIQWPLVGERTLKEREIEPGESDEVPAEFVIAPNIEQVLVYTHFKNASKRRQNISWNIETIYNLSQTESTNKTLRDQPVNGNDKSTNRRASCEGTRQGVGKPKPPGLQQPQPTIKANPIS